MTSPAPPDNAPIRPKDAGPNSWVDKSPSALEPFFRLSRFDRPIGIWLLAIPGWIGIAFSKVGDIYTLEDLKLGVLILIGAIFMRGAGCTYNDILDKDFDAKVERTAGRPLPAGRVSTKAAWAWTIAQCLVGLCVLLALPRFAQIMSLCSIPLVAAYPLMKRITWWPQAWLGLTLNWAVLVTPAAIKGHLEIQDFFLYAALMCWTIGYDTIYALQDKEDDALIGVKSTARRFGGKVKPMVSLIYGLCVILLGIATFLNTEPLAFLGVLIFAGHLALQATRTGPEIGDLALRLFKSNRDAAFLLFLGLSAPIVFP